MKKSFKKIIAAGLSVLLFSGLPIINDQIYASDHCNCDGLISKMLTDFKYNKEIKVATDFLKGYYYAKDRYTNFDFTQFSDNEYFLSYISGKIEAADCELEVYPEDDKQNYVLSLSCVDITNNEESTILKINSSVSFNYKGSDILSGYGEQNWISVKKADDGNYKVTDWYIPYNEYDFDIRGEISSLPKKNIWTKDSEVLLKRQSIVNNRLKRYFSSLNEQKVADGRNSERSDEDISKIKTLYSLNKTKISDWAKYNCKLAHPSSGNSNKVSAYFDFSTIQGNYDCTNFVSHAILAGGAALYDTGGTGISGTGWYFRNINNRSSSWSGVTNLHDFLVNNTTKGPVAKELNYADVYAPGGSFPYNYGDIIQFHNGSKWAHSGIITTFITASGSSTNLEAGVTSRTSSSIYTLNERQSQIYPGNSRRVLRLDGYYA